MSLKKMKLRIPLLTSPYTMYNKKVLAASLMGSTSVWVVVRCLISRLLVSFRLASLWKWPVFRSGAELWLHRRLRRRHRRKGLWDVLLLRERPLWLDELPGRQLWLDAGHRIGERHSASVRPHVDGWKWYVFTVSPFWFTWTANSFKSKILNKSC